MDPSVLLAITYVKETAQTDLRSMSSTAGRERGVRLLEDVLADPRVTADDNVQTEQTTDTDFNKLVRNQTIRTERRGCAEP